VLTLAGGKEQNTDMEENGRQTKRGFDTSRPVRNFIEVVRGVFVEPARFFAELRTSQDEEGEIVRAILFACICYVIAMPLSAFTAPLDPLMPELLPELFSGAQSNPRSAGFAFLVVLAPIFAVLMLLLVAAIQHLFVLLFVREGRGFWATFLVVSYGSTLALVSWIPVLSYLVSLYWVYVAIVGLRELHDTTDSRALLAVLITFLIGLGLDVYFVLFF